MNRVLVNADLINNQCNNKYTLIVKSNHDEVYDLVCLVDKTECEHIKFTNSSLRGYLKYAKIEEGDRILTLPLVPWYRRKVYIIPENNVVVVE